MKRAILAVLAAVLVLAPNARAGGEYVNAVSLTGASAASTIYYFDKTALGSTTTYASRQEVENWSVWNGGASEVTIRIYTKAAPIYLPPFSSADYSKDYVSIPLQPGQGVTLPGVTMIGWHLETAPSGGAVSVVGWNDD